MKNLLFLVLLLLCQLASFADYIGTITTNQADLSFSTKNGYDVISLKEQLYTTKVGAPQLPVKTISILIPIDQKVGNILINSITIQQLSSTFNVYPVQTPIRSGASQNSDPFDDPNSLIYNSATPYPGITYQITNDGYPMGYHVVTIKFYPVQYIPSSKIINLYTTINFTIVYANNTDNVLRPNRQSIYSNNLSKEYVQSIVSNPNDINSVTGGAMQVGTSGASTGMRTMGMSPTSLTNIPDYIIITNKKLITEAFNYSNYRISKGHNVLLVDVDELYEQYIEETTKA